MKIALNKCHGGFEFSNEAMVRLIERGASCLETRKLKEYYKDQPDRAFKDIRDGYKVDKFVRGILLKDETIYFVDFHNQDSRTDRNVIEIIEELGEDANGEHSEIEIEEIENTADFDIEDNDGVENINIIDGDW